MAAPYKSRQRRGSTSARSKPTEPSWSAQSALKSIVISGGLGPQVWDYTGRSSLNFSSPLVIVNVGHQHPSIIQAII